ncbi:hypothetical protein PINS_up010195 [Pythium insidiosum]|nr:hypothetical protein PINS_up010195 [Pythium insidiosum]
MAGNNATTTSKKSRKDGGTVAKEKKSKTPKEKSSRKKTKDPVTKVEEASIPSAKTHKPSHGSDPDAVQLFRRYDLSRGGALTRSDFLQLLRDYADPAINGRVRVPLALTESRGAPLGFARTEKNSEFEAGQLFERYDTEHTGALSLEQFQVFFSDFRSQLGAFVQDLDYRQLPQPLRSPEPARDATEGRHDSHPNSESPNKAVAHVQQDVGKQQSHASMRDQYQHALWELRRICRDELLHQREAVVQEVTSAVRYLSCPWLMIVS